jgi:hypothetical protein
MEAVDHRDRGFPRLHVGHLTDRGEAGSIRSRDRDGADARRL